MKKHRIIRVENLDTNKTYTGRLIDFPKKGECMRVAEYTNNMYFCLVTSVVISVKNNEFTTYSGKRYKWEMV